MPNSKPKVTGLFCQGQAVFFAFTWKVHFIGSIEIAMAAGLRSSGFFLYWYLVLPGDVNMDFVVDATDLAILGSSYPSQLGDSNYSIYADVNRDLKVDLMDLSIMGQHWGQSHHSCNPINIRMPGRDGSWLEGQD